MEGTRVRTRWAEFARQALAFGKLDATIRLQAKQILADLRRAGLTVAEEAGRLVVRGPLTDAQRKTVRENRDELLGALRKEAAEVPPECQAAIDSFRSTLNALWKDDAWKADCARRFEDMGSGTFDALKGVLGIFLEMAREDAARGDAAKVRQVVAVALAVAHGRTFVHATYPPLHLDHGAGLDDLPAGGAV